jgi:hypothetical protein
MAASLRNQSDIQLTQFGGLCGQSLLPNSSHAAPLPTENNSVNVFTSLFYSLLFFPLAAQELLPSLVLMT